MNYVEYLKSPRWLKLRRARIKKDKGRCQGCNGKQELNVHHKTYERFGHELLDDLITWCIRCHNDWHYFKRQIPATEKMILQQVKITEDEYSQYSKSLLRK